MWPRRTPLPCFVSPASLDLPAVEAAAAASAPHFDSWARERGAGSPLAACVSRDCCSTQRLLVGRGILRCPGCLRSSKARWLLAALPEKQSAAAASRSLRPGRDSLEQAEEDFFQFTRPVCQSLLVWTIPGLVLEVAYELTGQGPHQWEVLWFCWLLGAALGSMLGVADVLRTHHAARAAAHPPRRALVTGASRGLGKALAREFLLAGDSVLLAARGAAAVQAALAELQRDAWELGGRQVEARLVEGRGGLPAEWLASPPQPQHVASAGPKRQRPPEAAELRSRCGPPPQRLVGVVCDVGRAEDVERMAQVALQELGGVDIWVNNAGTNPQAKPFLNFSPEELSAVAATNMLGTLLGTRQALQLMARQPSGGHIFNMEGAGSGGAATPRYAAYGATKSGLRQLQASLLAEAAQSRRSGAAPVGIHAASPGMVLTDLLLSGATLQNKQAFNFICEHPETVARALVPQMRTVTGSGRQVAFLTPPRIVLALLTAWLRRGRWFDKEGQAVYAAEADRLRTWASDRSKASFQAFVEGAPFGAWISLASSTVIGIYIAVSSWMSTS